MRQQLVKFRTMQINSLRGLLTEYGEVMGQGPSWTLHRRRIRGPPRSEILAEQGKPVVLPVTAGEPQGTLLVLRVRQREAT